jgi:hypothetical protein
MLQFPMLFSEKFLSIIDLEACFLKLIIVHKNILY